MAKRSPSPAVVIGTAVCEALGVDPLTVTGFDLHVRIDEPVTMTIETIPDRPPEGWDDLRDAISKITHYEIREVSDGEG